MFDDASPHRTCPHCRRHYLFVAGPDGTEGYRPACSCEADAARAERTRELVETARPALDDVQRAIADECLRPPA